MNAISEIHTDFAARLSRIATNCLGHTQALFVGLGILISMLPWRGISLTF